jgi:hypothetical protein
MGTRDRSWGVRPVGARDAQALAPPVDPQFFWIWSPANFDSGSFFFHTNDDAAGAPWNRRAVWAPDKAGSAAQHEIAACGVEIDWTPGTRQARRAVVRLGDTPGGREIVYEPSYAFFMLGLGYGHPSWGHGVDHGPLSVEREDLRLAEVDLRLPHHLHVQALCRVTYREGGRTVQVGRGVLEQLALGPHAPSGFAGLLDTAR